MAVGRVAVKGGAVVVGREADEGPKENGGRACSATVRHAGMCPAAAAGLEYDDRTGERIILHNPPAQSSRTILPQWGIVFQRNSFGARYDLSWTVTCPKIL